MKVSNCNNSPVAKIRTKKKKKKKKRRKKKKKKKKKKEEEALLAAANTSMQFRSRGLCSRPFTRIYDTRSCVHMAHAFHWNIRNNRSY